MNGIEEEEESEEEGEEGLEGSGWQLLNCVESGGTLSSLFTILSLFTEDVKLRYEEDQEEEKERNRDVHEFSLDSEGGIDRDGPPVGLRRPSTNGGKGKMSDTEDADDERGEIGSGGLGGKSQGQQQQGKKRSFGGTGLTSTEGEDSTIAEEPEEEGDQEDEGEGRTRTARGTPSFAKQTTQTPSAYPFPPMNQRTSSSSTSNNFERPSMPPFGQSSRRDVPRKRRSTKTGNPNSSKQFETTLARATVDTTLAVIPAEAFRRLTKKFPNAAAYVLLSLLFPLKVEC